MVVTYLTKLGGSPEPLMRVVRRRPVAQIQPWSKVTLTHSGAYRPATSTKSAPPRSE
jgi:hypothetical protein